MQQQSDYNVPIGYQSMKTATADLDLYLELTAISEEISKCRASQLA